MNETVNLSSKTKAILYEIHGALQRFINTGEIRSIFINKMSLAPEERQEIRDFLGQGSIKIILSDSAEPAEWMESGISGIWYGVFYDQANNPILETIEIGKFPQVASSQVEDINRGLKTLKLGLETDRE
jgi:hypothetical protein